MLDGESSGGDPKHEFASSFFCCAGTAMPRKNSRANAAAPATWCDLIVDIKAQLGTLLGVSAENVVLFHNTMGALQRVLLRLNQELRRAKPLLLTTDLEFPGLIATANEYWDGPLAVAEIAQLVWTGRCVEVEERLCRAARKCEPQVVVISHVDRSFGYEVESGVIRRLKRSWPEAVVIVDGAQAIGNIAVDLELVSDVDFYVGGTHKWLGGPPTLGFVCSDRKWRIDDPAQAYSRMFGSGGTGNLETLRGTRDALTEYGQQGLSVRGRLLDVARHNHDLAEQFWTRLQNLGGSLIPIGAAPNGYPAWSRNGIVTVGGDIRSVAAIVDTSGDPSELPSCVAHGRVMATLIRSEPWITPQGREVCAPRMTVAEGGREEPQLKNFFESEPPCTPLPYQELLRFCFHQFHSAADVSALVEKLAEASRRQRPKCVLRAARHLDTDHQPHLSVGRGNSLRLPETRPQVGA